MKNNISNFKECANCGACYNACPTEAIKVLSDGLFYNLQVDNIKCVECGKCMKVCPVNNPEKHQSLIFAIGGFSKNLQMVKKSSSGGAFSVFAEYVLSKNGVVFAAAFNENSRYVEIKSTDEVPLDMLIRSKYVESSVGDSFIKVKQQLDNSRLVLFCGCPCQVAGLKRFLGMDYDNLITCDFSCGGLPSHKIYNDYLNKLENKFNSEVEFVNFRPKTYGWETYAIKVAFKNGREYNSLSLLDPFFVGFIHKHYTVRDNCLTCRFADNHYSDIILADFWLYREISNLQKGNGLSLIIINSNKGKNFFGDVKEKFEFEELELEKATYNIKKPNYTEEFRINRKKFLDEYKEKGLLAIQDYLPNRFSKVKIIFKNTIKKVLKH